MSRAEGSAGLGCTSRSGRLAHTMTPAFTLRRIIWADAKAAFAFDILSIEEEP
jgi:hypothetical protein